MIRNIPVNIEFNIRSPEVRSKIALKNFLISVIRDLPIYLRTSRSAQVYISDFHLYLIPYQIEIRADFHKISETRNEEGVAYVVSVYFGRDHKNQYITEVYLCFITHAMYYS